MTRAEARVARRRRRTEAVRVTPPRLTVRADGTVAFTPAKVRGPKRGKVARAVGRAAAERVGSLKMGGRHPEQIAARKAREQERKAA